MRRRRAEQQEERAIFGRKGTANRYQMPEKLVVFGDDYYIKNEAGRNIFKVDGKVLRVRDTLRFNDIQGNVLCQIQECMLMIKDTMAIENVQGKEVARVKKALITPLRDRWTVRIGNRPDQDVQGNILDHEYEISEGRRKVAKVSKKWSFCAIPTVWKLPLTRKISSSWQSLWIWTRWPITEMDYSFIS